ncbi:trans-sulfuration enzyme family protein [Pantoea ananatis]|uniref:trans-sulfuration enzyme family protein n=1 Tax=Pantoea ananas TaxID=553 RepID=UPI001B31687F|nr:PLP-dependent aspartate aminotransferase family protein [Pantoea ananatis]
MSKINEDKNILNNYRFNNAPVTRGASVQFDSIHERRLAADKAKTMERGWTYGLDGSPSHWCLEDELSSLELGDRCELFSTGLSAITCTFLSLLTQGDHILIPQSVYGPVRRFVRTMLSSFGVSATFYNPCFTPEDLERIINPNTKILFIESPGSYTFEVQDMPGLAKIANLNNITVVVDNTWGIKNIFPLKNGADVVIHSATKYLSGHSDVLLGAVITRNKKLGDKISKGRRVIGEHVSPDDCWLVSRGLKTLNVRMKVHESNALSIATWFSKRLQIVRVLHPAFESCHGHEFWKRDFIGSSGVFSVLFSSDISIESIYLFCDSLKLFKIGASWGDTESLVYPAGEYVRRDTYQIDLTRLVRFSIGLEKISDLIQDLERAFSSVYND